MGDSQWSTEPKQDSQGRHSNQCHRAMARVDLLPRPEIFFTIFWPTVILDQEQEEPSHRAIDVIMLENHLRDR